MREKIILDWEKYKEKAVEMVSEGIVMLKNENHALPLQKGQTVAVVGRIQYHYYKSGTGSGGLVNVPEVVSIPEGLVICDDVYERILKDFYEGMESTEEIRKRAMNEILAIAKEYSGKNILIPTHSHFIKGLFTAIDAQITFQSYLANGGLNFVEVEDGKIISHRFNQ